ncbi:hypothetical protein Pmani_000452 [Petrolisthes manimaculis]|uniref:Uncharacterized protein n=1 Tax=Petrolisthes manimaculis TaxID=1843537 RepID=A0AAE1USS1_9EUCA|nr:hypothetical protein Pmani_000452 [Petrolisthes manimaculis]
MSSDSQETLIDALNVPDENPQESALQHEAPVEAPHHTPPQGHPTVQPSLDCPTREYLDKNFLKSDLQKRCRELGVTSIWISKSQLIERILEKSQSTSNDTHSHLTGSAVEQTPPPENDTPTHEDNTMQDRINVLDIAKDIKMIKSKLATKDEEIELLNTEVNAAYQTIHQLQQRVTELEKQYGESSDHYILAGGDTSPSGCLLLGDKNLDDLCFDKVINSYSTLNRLGAVKLLNAINKQCPTFTLCSNWQEVRRNINTYTAQLSEQQNAGHDSHRPAQRPPAPLGALTPRPEPDHRTASPAQKSYGHPTTARFPSTTPHRPPYHRYSTEHEAIPQLAVTTGTVREEAIGEREVRGTHGSNTYAAVLRGATGERHHSPAHATGTRGRHEDNSSYRRIPTSVLQGQEHHQDDSQHYQHDTRRRNTLKLHCIP